MKKPTNRLNTGETLKLAKWLEEHKSTLNGHSAPNIAKLAQKAMAFEVGDSAIRTIGRELGYVFEKKKAPKDAKEVIRLLVELCAAVYGEDAEQTLRARTLLGDDDFETV
jgi:hypothetical protein